MPDRFHRGSASKWFGPRASFSKFGPKERPRRSRNEASFRLPSPHGCPSGSPSATYIKTGLTLPPERRSPTRQLFKSTRNAPDRRSALHGASRVGGSVKKSAPSSPSRRSRYFLVPKRWFNGYKRFVLPNPEPNL